MKRILLVDDHPIYRDGLARLIESDKGLRVCGAAGDVQEALRILDDQSPDLVIADINLPGRNGLELVKDLVATHPGIPVIALSMHDEMVYAERVLRAGGRAYVMKDEPPERLLEAVRVVLHGGVFASRTVTNHLLHSLSSGKASLKGKAKPSFPLERLTDREMEVFELIGQAMSNHEIAARLGISPRTLDAHRAHIREKLGLGDGGELTRHAIRWVEVGAIGNTAPAGKASME
jgi:DNA-binding NarL/FixJ family response regulator